MNKEKFEWEEEIKQDRETELMQDITRPDEFDEYHEFADAFARFRVFCITHDIDFEKVLEEMIG